MAMRTDKAGCAQDTGCDSQLLWSSTGERACQGCAAGQFRGSADVGTTQANCTDCQPGTYSGAGQSASCGGEGLIFEAYEPGDSFDWESLAGIADTAFDDVWNGWDPVVQHTEARGDIWYQGSDQMAAEIPMFSATNRFVMRFRGTIAVPTAGTYTFKTASDDGSMLYIDQQEIVNNDGNHGVSEQSADVDLAAGPHAQGHGWGSLPGSWAAW